PAPPEGATVVDLGCGSGVVAATIAHRHPGVHLVCCDESYQALASTRAPLAPVAPDAELHVTAVLDGVDDARAGLVVLSPPFHAGGARSDAVARRMVAEPHRVLRPGGELRLVANRHLDHHVAVR